MNQRAQIAIKYFDAFHAGRIDEILNYFAKHGTVQFAKEPERKATDFFAETKELIASIKFTTHGVYASDSTNNVLIHFSFSMPDQSGGAVDVEAVDIIAFDDSNKIENIKVITSQ